MVDSLLHSSPVCTALLGYTGLIDFISEFSFAFLLGIAFYFYDVFRHRDKSERIGVVGSILVAGVLGILLLFFAIYLNIPIGEIFTTAPIGIGGKLVFMFWSFISIATCYSLASIVSALSKPM